MKHGNPRYSRFILASVFLPYGYYCAVYKGLFLKGLMLYLMYREFNALNDLAYFLRFYFKCPKYMRKLLELDEEKSFAAIQTRLYVRYCAEVELKKASGEQRKKKLTELAMIKPFRNGIKDTITSWKNFFTVMRHKMGRRYSKGDED